MKIFFIGGRDIFSVGGIENWMLHLSAALAERGHDVTVCCESDHDGLLFYQDVRVLYFKAPRSKYLCKMLASLRATRRALEEGCDLIHYNVWPSAVWSAMAERKGVKTILMGHGFEWKRSKYNGMQRWILRFCEERAARRHKHIVLCSREQTDWYIRHYACEGKVVTIPSAVDLPSSGLPSAPDVLAASSTQVCLQADTPVVLYMGRISPEKNVDLLIRSFSRVCAGQAMNARLLIAGSLDESAAYGQSIKAMIDASENVDFLGEVFGDEKDALLRRTDLFCLPSSIEGLSIALLEAAAYRIPVIVSDIPSNREALGDAALWVKAEDGGSLENALGQALAALAPDVVPHSPSVLSVRALLERNADAAFERVAADFTWERSAALYEDYIRSI